MPDLASLVYQLCPVINEIMMTQESKMGVFGRPKGDSRLFFSAGFRPHNLLAFAWRATGDISAKLFSMEVTRGNRNVHSKTSHAIMLMKKAKCDSVHITHLTLSHLMWLHFMSALASDPVRRGRDHPDETARPTSFWLVAATANWVASHKTHLVQMKYEVTRYRMRWTLLKVKRRSDSRPS